MCENIVKFIRKQPTKKRREMFLNLIKGFAADDQNEGDQIIFGEVDPVIKRDDIRDMNTSQIPAYIIKLHVLKIKPFSLHSVV